MFRRTVPAVLKGVTGRVLAAAPAEGGTWVGATPGHLLLAGAGDQPRAVPWHEVRAGVWDRMERRLTVRLRGGEELALVFPEDAPELVQAFHERVGASMVLQRDVVLRGARVHVTIRKDLTTREMFDDVAADPGVDLADPATAAAVEAARRDLRDQVGLPL